MKFSWAVLLASFILTVVSEPFLERTNFCTMFRPNLEPREMFLSVFSISCLFNFLCGRTTPSPSINTFSVEGHSHFSVALAVVLYSFFCPRCVLLNCDTTLILSLFPRRTNIFPDFCDLCSFWFLSNATILNSNFEITTHIQVQSLGFPELHRDPHHSLSSAAEGLWPNTSTSTPTCRHNGEFIAQARYLSVLTPIWPATRPRTPIRWKDGEVNWTQFVLVSKLNFSSSQLDWRTNFVVSPRRTFWLHHSPSLTPKPWLLWENYNTGKAKKRTKAPLKIPCTPPPTAFHQGFFCHTRWTRRKFVLADLITKDYDILVSLVPEKVFFDAQEHALARVSTSKSQSPPAQWRPQQPTHLTPSDDKENCRVILNPTDSYPAVGEQRPPGERRAAQGRRRREARAVAGLLLPQNQVRPLPALHLLEGRRWGCL